MKIATFVIHELTAFNTNTNVLCRWFRIQIEKVGVTNLVKYTILLHILIINYHIIKMD